MESKQADKSDQRRFSDIDQSRVADFQRSARYQQTRRSQIAERSSMKV
jgi:hypothetical protein